MSETLDFDPDALREKYRHERDQRLRPEALSCGQAPNTPISKLISKAAA